MNRVRINEDNIFTLLSVGSWILLALLTLGGAVFGSLRFAASVLTGGVLAIANFYWLASVVKRLLLLPAGQAGRFALLRYVLRLAVMAVAIWVLIVHFGIHLVGLIVGLSVLVLNIVALAVYKLTLKGG